MLSYDKESYTSEDGLNALLLVKDKENAKIYVVFRGSDSFEDWIQTNFQWLRIRLPKYSLEKRIMEYFDDKILVHAGFQRAYQSLRLEMLRQVEKALADLNEKVTVVFTGHSMGGAIANLAALDFKFRNPAQKVQVVTFGCPRVGNYAFSRMVRKIIGSDNYVRVAHWFDLVTYTPPIGYTHAELVPHYVGNWKILYAHDMGNYLSIIN